MSRLDRVDHMPGAPIDTRRLPSGAVVLIMRIAGDDRGPAGRLVLRCEPDGQVLGAITDHGGSSTEEP